MAIPKDSGTVLWPILNDEQFKHYDYGILCRVDFFGQDDFLPPPLKVIWFISNIVLTHSKTLR